MRGKTDSTGSGAGGWGWNGSYMIEKRSQKCQASGWGRGKRYTLVVHILLLLWSGAAMEGLGAGLSMTADSFDAVSLVRWQWLLGVLGAVFADALATLLSILFHQYVAGKLRMNQGATAEEVISQVGGIATISPVRLVRTGQVFATVVWGIIWLVQVAGGLYAVLFHRIVALDAGGFAVRPRDPYVVPSLLGIGALLAVLALFQEARYGKFDLLCGQWVLLSMLDPRGENGMCAANDAHIESKLHGFRFYLRDVASASSVGHIELTVHGYLPQLASARSYAGRHVDDGDHAMVLMR